MNFTNINLFIRFNKIREIFPSITRVLSILVITAAIRASVERLISISYQPITSAADEDLTKRIIFRVKWKVATKDLFP